MSPGMADAGTGVAAKKTINASQEARDSVETECDGIVASFAAERHSTTVKRVLPARQFGSLPNPMRPAEPMRRKSVSPDFGLAASHMCSTSSAKNDAVLLNSCILPWVVTWWTCENQQHRFSGRGLRAVATLRKVEDVPDQLLAHRSPLGRGACQTDRRHVWGSQQGRSTASGEQAGSDPSLWYTSIVLIYHPQ